MDQPLETLREDNALTQEIMSAAVCIIKAAMQVGAGHARVQLLRQRYGHFHYVTTTEGTLTFPVHDAQTLVVLEGGMRQRVQLSRPAHDFVRWIRKQGLQVLCTTSAMQSGGGGGLASWLYLVAVFVPWNDADGRLNSLWNGMHCAKCLDASASEEWSARCQRALGAGASHCMIAILYYQSDFTGEGNMSARHYLTIQPMNGKWSLDDRMQPLVTFARTCGYAWTLCIPNSEDPGWAYFTILLDPLTQYEQIK